MSLSGYILRLPVDSFQMKKSRCSWRRPLMVWKAWIPHVQRPAAYGWSSPWGSTERHWKIRWADHWLCNWAELCYFWNAKQVTAPQPVLWWAAGKSPCQLQEASVWSPVDSMASLVFDPKNFWNCPILTRGCGSEPTPFSLWKTVLLDPGDDNGQGDTHELLSSLRLLHFSFTHHRVHCLVSKAAGGLGKNPQSFPPAEELKRMNRI